MKLNQVAPPFDMVLLYWVLFMVTWSRETDTYWSFAIYFLIKQNEWKYAKRLNQKFRFITMERGSPQQDPIVSFITQHPQTRCCITTKMKLNCLKKSKIKDCVLVKISWKSMLILMNDRKVGISCFCNCFKVAPQPIFFLVSLLLTFEHKSHTLFF